MKKPPKGKPVEVDMVKINEHCKRLAERAMKAEAENAVLRPVADAAEVAIRKAEASLILHARAKTYHHHTSPCTLEAIAAFKAALARLREHREGKT